MVRIIRDLKDVYWWLASSRECGYTLCWWWNGENNLQHLPPPTSTIQSCGMQDRNTVEGQTYNKNFNRNFLYCWRMGVDKGIIRNVFKKQVSPHEGVCLQLSVQKFSLDIQHSYQKQDVTSISFCRVSIFAGPTVYYILLIFSLCKYNTVLLTLSLYECTECMYVCQCPLLHTRFIHINSQTICYSVDSANYLDYLLRIV